MLSIWCLERSTLPKPIIAIHFTFRWWCCCWIGQRSPNMAETIWGNSTWWIVSFLLLLLWVMWCPGLNDRGCGHLTLYDHCPMQVVVTKSEAGQLCLLGLVNLAFVTGHLPVMWKIVPVIPIRKPGKIAGDIAGHRPISLMAAVFKLLDKMLYRRIWPAIVSATSPWQGGGTIGADAMAWMVSQSCTTGEKLAHMILHSQPLWMGKVLSVGPLRV